MRLTRVLGCVSKLPKNFANFPESYIKKQTEFISYKPPNRKNYQNNVKRWRKRAYYELARPWSNAFQEQNTANQFQPNIYTEPLTGVFPVFRGDRVQILRGKDKGKQGLVNYIVEERNWVCVEGLNLVQSWQSKSDYHPGQIVMEQAPLLLHRDVCLVDPQDELPTRVEWRLDEEGNQVRVSLRSGRIIPIPSKAFETIDYKLREAYLEQEKDTPVEAASEQTFEWKCKTFEMDIMDQMGEKEERIPYPMHWY